MYECGQQRENGTWILEPMLEAYTHLHNLGQAHSVEAWEGEELAGGLYGVHRGGLFAAESMFHRRTNASKLVLLSSVSTLFELGIELFDVQFLTEHLETLGAREIPRAQYLRRLARARSRAVDLSQLALEDPLAHLRRRIGAPLNKHQ
jgi:leucyl/phenylalanyl-tRNA--protein transferase